MCRAQPHKLATTAAGVLVPLQIVLSHSPSIRVEPERIHFLDATPPPNTSAYAVLPAQTRLQPPLLLLAAHAIPASEATQQGSQHAAPRVLRARTRWRQATQHARLVLLIQPPRRQKAPPYLRARAMQAMEAKRAHPWQQAAQRVLRVFTRRRQATPNALPALRTRPTPRARPLKLLALAMQATEAMLSQAAAL